MRLSIQLHLACDKCKVHKLHQGKTEINAPINTCNTIYSAIFCCTDSAVTPIMGSPLPGLHGQVLESDSDEFSPVPRKEKALGRQLGRKKRKGKIEVSFNMGKLTNVSDCHEHSAFTESVNVAVVGVLY